MQKSRKKLNLGIVTLFMALLISIFVFPKTAEAKSIYADETEPNDTRSQAQEIQENRSTPDGFYETELGGTYQMNGRTSSSDEDWFKVYLTKGLKYFTCGESSFEYYIEDEAGNRIDEKTYEAGGARIFPFEISADGIYYVRIKGITSETTKYYFYVGGPVWGVGSVEIACNPKTINMTGASKTGIFDATNMNIPKDAVVSSLHFYNMRTTSVKGITLKNSQGGPILRMRQYVWNADDLESQHIPAQTMWTATFEYGKTTSFEPTLKMYYLYPKYQ